MIGHRCKNCIWWDSQHPSIGHVPIGLDKYVIGFCRKHKPGSLKIGQYFYGVQPVMDADEFCGEFRPNEE